VRYEGKTVLITGGGSGLGRAMALAFAKEGATVATIGRRQEALDETSRLIEEGGGKGLGISCDVRDAARVGETIGQVVDRTGRLDVLVNNAAGNFISPAEQLSPNGFKAVVDIVLLGTFNCSRLAFDALKESRGAILNIIATYAWTGEPGAIHSAAAKAGVLNLTQTLAGEWGRYGIRANAIAPGPIHTEGTDKNLWSVGDVEKMLVRNIPLGRLGEPGDVARAALWLCGPEADWVSGACLTVDGGAWVHGGSLNFRRAFDAMAGAGEKQ
jgi:NAD(P)-dependent dehydrogenase (short-subunit alcohol dehydrogenase family)